MIWNNKIKVLSSQIANFLAVKKAVIVKQYTRTVRLEKKNYIGKFLFYHRHLIKYKKIRLFLHYS